MHRFPSVARRALRHVLPCALALCTAVASRAVTALEISGSPQARVAAGKHYWFKPTATDSRGKIMVFHIAHKPSWASFNRRTGQLAGTPGSAAVGYDHDIRISVSDGTTIAALPVFFIHVCAADKFPPVVSGVAPTRVMAGSAYRFQPLASDAAGNAMWFAIRNKPPWTEFNSHTGLLTGTPTSAEIGTYRDISIHVTDGQMSGSTSAFSITVLPRTGEATLSWTRPTENTDGTALTDLAGYRLYYGRSPSDLSNVIELPDQSRHTYTIENLTVSTWFFAIRAYTTSGLESTMSQIVSKSLN